ncbi:MAG: class II glutamine amidotransferase [Pseudomonadales bacterium]|nr:class II glutamine amidotransferase [Pseudomonadales bacterium]
MCELLGMSANVPTDICFSFTGLMQRGGKTGPHRDGWGIAFYEGRGVREFKDPHPGAESQIARLVSEYPIKSHIVISHIRQANSGKVCLENTHPFTRELWGRPWVFAHNGQLNKSKLRRLKESGRPFYSPIGTTDSELAFCWILDSLRSAFPNPPRRQKDLFLVIRSLCDQLSDFGVFNMLLSDSHFMLAYCRTQLCWITRKAPFGEAKLKDEDLTVNFKEETTEKDIVTVVATQPLTNNEKWNVMAPGEMVVLKKGKVNLSVGKQSNKSKIGV